MTQAAVSAADGQPLTSEAVTVIVPTRDAARWLPGCLLGARLNRPREIIVVDGRSSDGTAELAHRGADRVLRDDGRGVAAARQFAVAVAETEWLFLLDADVVIGPGLLEGLLAEARERGLDAIQAALYSIDGGDYWSRQLARHHNGGQVRDWFGVSATLIRRSVLQRHPFDGRLRSGEDIDLRMRLRHAGVPCGVSQEHRVVHRFAAGRAFCAGQWGDDGAGLGRMVRVHGMAAVPNALVPFPAAVLGALDGLTDFGRPLPYFAGFVAGNWRGLLRGLRDDAVPVSRPRHALTISVALGIALLAVVFPILILAVCAAAVLIVALAGGGAAWTGVIVLTAVAALVLQELWGRRWRQERYARLLRPLRLMLVAFALVVALARIIGLIF